MDLLLISENLENECIDIDYNISNHLFPYSLQMKKL